jgi:tetratricopeptide (TPR) repeat protein
MQEHVTTDASSDTPARAPGGAVLASPPGYELIDEIGRGGMGVVYRARDVALDRHVAVKLLSDHYPVGSITAQRFLTEARITGQLQHPGVPAVHQVGTLHGGRPFLAMKLIKGDTLEELLKARPDPSADRGRYVAIFEQVCQAVGYAHSHRVIHRDIKPGNVMVGAFGEVQVMDWGLAKALGEEVAPGGAAPADAGTTRAWTEISPTPGSGSHTQAGSTVGTLAYISPEQAIGEIDKVNERSDVFGLGALLAVILTGKPPYVGESSAAVRVLAVRGTLDDCFARLDASGAEPELVGLCKRCLAFEPGDRPRDAGEVAQAVARWRTAAEERARAAERDRAAADVRAAEQAKRRRAVQWAAGVVAGVLLLGVAGTTLGLLQANHSRQIAEKRKQEADAAKEEAQKNAGEAQKQGALALRSLGTLIDEVQAAIGDTPNLQPLKLKLLDTALKGLDKVAASDEDSRLLGQSMAAAYMRMGQLFQQLGQSEKAFTQYEKCHAIIADLAARDPDGDVAQANLAATFTMLGEMSLELRRDIQASLDFYQKALEIRKNLTQRQLSDKLDATKVKWDLTESYTRVGVTFLRLGEPARARAFFREALTARQELAAAAGSEPSPRLDVARSHNALGEVEFRARRWPAARTHFQEALTLCERVHQEHPKNPRYQLELANSLGNFGVFELRTGDLKGAQEHVGRQLALMQGLVDLDKKNALYQRYLALANYRMATLAQRRKDRTVSDRCNRACLEIRERLAAADPTNERRQIELTLVLPRCGQHERAAQRAVKVRQGPSADREILVELAQCYAQCAAAIDHDASLRRQYAEKAVEALNQAVSKNYRDVVLLETEPDLGALREHPDFRSLIVKLKER